MTKEYQDTIREGFENHIAKQLKLEDVHKDVLAVQVFAMNKKLEYADKKLQIKWGEWEAACSQQIEKDAGIVDFAETYCNDGEETLIVHIANNIRNQL